MPFFFSLNIYLNDEFKFKRIYNQFSFELKVYNLVLVLTQSRNMTLLYNYNQNCIEIFENQVDILIHIDFV